MLLLSIADKSKSNHLLEKLMNGQSNLLTSNSLTLTPGGIGNFDRIFVFVLFSLINAADCCICDKSKTEI